MIVSILIYFIFYKTILVTDYALGIYLLTNLDFLEKVYNSSLKVRF